MTERVKILFLSLLLTFGLMLASFFAGWKIRGDKIQMPVADTVVIHTVDTLTVTERIRDTVTKTYYKTIQVPFSDVEVDTGDDSVRVTLPYERHFAKLEDVADVWYSGYDAKIDSAVVYKHHTTEIVNHVIEANKMTRLTIDVGAGAMWHEQAVKPFAVGKLNLNRPHTTFTAFGAINPDGDWAAGLTVTYRMNLIK